MPRPAAAVLTFIFVALSFITVSTADFATTIAFVGKLGPSANLVGTGAFRAALPASDLRVMLLPLLFGCVAAFVGPRAEDIAKRLRPSTRSDLAIILVLLVTYVFLHARVVTEFRYRQF
jgi:hypothetical protein